MPKKFWITYFALLPDWHAQQSSLLTLLINFDLNYYCICTWRGIDNLSFKLTIQGDMFPLPYVFSFSHLSDGVSLYLVVGICPQQYWICTVKSAQLKTIQIWIQFISYKKFKNCVNFLPAFYLIMWLMTSQKNFEKKPFLKYGIWFSSKVSELTSANYPWYDAFSCIEIERQYLLPLINIF